MGQRAIKESIYIRVNHPILNKNIGKYNLSHIWDGVLVWIKTEWETSINKSIHDSGARIYTPTPAANNRSSQDQLTEYS